MPAPQGRYWLLTLPVSVWSPALPDLVCYVKGQQEIGCSTGFQHWQLMVIYRKKVTLRQVKRDFGEQCHAELSRSSAADTYVWKDDTAVPDTRFELGQRPVRRHVATDWDRVWELAKSGQFESIPANIRVQNYRTLRSIASDFDRPLGMVRTCYVYWGATGTGKSREAWATAGMDAYPKDPRTKFWCGYSGQKDVIIDEFRGGCLF